MLNWVFWHLVWLVVLVSFLGSCLVFFTLSQAVITSIELPNCIELHWTASIFPQQILSENKVTLEGPCHKAVKNTRMKKEIPMSRAHAKHSPR